MKAKKYLLKNSKGELYYTLIDDMFNHDTLIWLDIVELKTDTLISEGVSVPDLKRCTIEKKLQKEGYYILGELY